MHIIVSFLHIWKFPMGLLAAVTKHWFTLPLLLPQCNSPKSSTSCVCLLGTGNSLDFADPDKGWLQVFDLREAGLMDKATQLLMVKENVYLNM